MPRPTSPARSTKSKTPKYRYQTVRRDASGKFNPRGRTKVRVRIAVQTGRKLIRLASGIYVSDKGKKGKDVVPLLAYLKRQGILPDGDRVTIEELRELRDRSYGKKA